MWDQIKVQFETSRNLFLYGFFNYRFISLSVKESIAALEAGLRLFLSLGDDPKGKHFRNNTIKPLLERAYTNKFFDVKHLSEYNEFTLLAEEIRNIRNRSSHGSIATVMPQDALKVICTVCEILDQVFEHVRDNDLKQSLDGWE